MSLYSDFKDLTSVAWIMNRPIGLIPDFLYERDPRTAQDQFNERYAHGGGWKPLLTDWSFDPETGALSYPDDPVYEPVAIGRLHDQVIFVYDYDWVCILNADGSFEVSRMD